ncbi:hypothetical protein HK104_000670, partial [Borealophlyctis nickersoniae]
DSRHLKGSLFEDGSYDHILSHPPYKDCVSYSTHIEGDLSKFPDMAEFQVEMAKVADETWRRCTLGIGDNRRECFYQPVSFQTMRTYLDAGFEIEEIIIKRQRYCQMAPLGVFLCTHYDFLMFTHEYVAILRKVERGGMGKNSVPYGAIGDGEDAPNRITPTRTLRAVPYCPIDRKSVVMGTVWTFKVTKRHSLARLAMSKLVERFGRNDAVWEEVSFPEFRNEVLQSTSYHEICAERDPRDEDEDDEDEEATTREACNNILCAQNNLEEDIGEYERERRHRIRLNHLELFTMGLVSDLSPEGEDDVKYLRSLLLSPILPPTTSRSPSLIFIPHINVPSTALLDTAAWVARYRRFIVECARDAVERLEDGGYFIVGVKDVRVGDRVDDVEVEALDPSPPSTLIPLTLLTYEDITTHVPATPAGSLRLKEMVIAVPEGFARDKTIPIEEMRARVKEDMEEWAEEREGGCKRVLPIVQASYFIYIKSPALSDKYPDKNN